MTCAAPNFRAHPNNAMNPGRDKPISLRAEEIAAIHKCRGRHFLAVAAANGADIVIHGAFGCGAFRKPAAVVDGAYQISCRSSAVSSGKSRSRGTARRGIRGTTRRSGGYCGSDSPACGRVFPGSWTRGCTVTSVMSASLLRPGLRAVTDKVRNVKGRRSFLPFSTTDRFAAKEIPGTLCPG